MGALFWTDSTYCLITKYEIVEETSPGVYAPTTDFAFLTNDGGTNAGVASSDLRVRTNNPTPLAGVKRFIRASTVAGRKYEQPFQLYVCGSEVISTSMTTIPFYFYYYA